MKERIRLTSSKLQEKISYRRISLSARLTLTKEKGLHWFCSWQKTDDCVGGTAYGLDALVFSLC